MKPDLVPGFVVSGHLLSANAYSSRSATLIAAAVQLTLDIAECRDLHVDALRAPGHATDCGDTPPLSVLMCSAFGAVEFVIDVEGTTWMVESDGIAVAPRVTQVHLWHEAQDLALQCIAALGCGRKFHPSIH
jgi:hypothetical protein